MRTTTLVVMVLLLSLAGMALAANSPTRTLSGVYTCIDCRAAKANGTTSQCSIYGHHYALLLNDGRYVTFLNNDHSQALVKGGGRTDFPMKVTGVYNRQARTIDVVSYEIDGIKTVWSDQRLAMVRATDHQVTFASQLTSR